jgi:tetratricopeptide (TPR) repeat protein
VHTIDVHNETATRARRHSSAFARAARALLATGFAVAGAVTGAATTAFAQQPFDPASNPAAGPAPSTARSSGRLPVTIVAGKLVAACDLATNARRIPANLFVDFDRQCALELHNSAAGRQALDVEGANPPREVRIIFPDLELSNVGRAHGDEDFLNDFTKYHSHEIGENAVVGTIGAGILSRYHVTIDLANGYLQLDAPRTQGANAARAVSPSADDFDVPITLDSGLVWLPARLPGDVTGAMALGTSRHDALIDELVVDDLDAPAGDVEFLRIGPLDVATVLALRPEPSTLAHPDGALGILGIGFLESFRVEIDRVNRFARIQRSAKQPFPADDRAFFAARVREEADATEAFLDAWPEARLTEEAARLLVDQRLEEFADEPDLRRAIERYVGSRPKDLRCSTALDLLKALRAEGEETAAVLAGECGLPSAREDRYPESGPQVRSRLGQILYARGDLDGAWRHLLSAAFNQPDDGTINLYLGRVYEDRGWLERAQSRYVQAIIVPESGPQAMEGLERVALALGEGGGLSVDTVDLQIAGKVYGFGAATRYRPDADVKPNRRVLVEYFAGAHLDHRAALGGALAFEGLASHFGDEYLVPLTYHVPIPKLSPLCTDVAEQVAARRGVTGGIVNVIDGVSAQRAAGRHRDADALYDMSRQAVVTELGQFSDYEIDIVASHADGRLVGDVLASGPADPDLDLMVLLAERGVLFPGASQVVVHRHVVRANLAERAGGVTWSEDADELSYRFDVALADLVDEHRAWLAAEVAKGAEDVPTLGTALDPRQLVVVAYLIDRATGEVAQANSARVELTEQEL